jgi:hypothetical protein
LVIFFAQKEISALLAKLLLGRTSGIGSRISFLPANSIFSQEENFIRQRTPINLTIPTAGVPQFFLQAKGWLRGLSFHDLEKVSHPTYQHFEQKS